MRIFVKLVCLENKQDHFFQNSKVRAVVVYSLEKKKKKWCLLKVRGECVLKFTRA